MGVKASLAARNLRPRKKWGQHFLTDQRILESIADAAAVEPTDIVLEIGPGLGHLTRVLARRAGRVIAVEIDAELAAQLKNDFANTSNVTIAPGDFLNAAPIDWIRNRGEQPLAVPSYKIVANLPYYITSAILRHILDAQVKPQMIVVMVQRQVAQRIVAQPPAMNLLAVSVQYYAQPRIVRTIAAGAFYPPPKVDSAVVRLDVHATPREHTAPEKFFELVRAGFGERRKQVFNALRHNLPHDPATISRALNRAQIAPTRRAETLSLADWLALERALAK